MSAEVTEGKVVIAIARFTLKFLLMAFKFIIAVAFEPQKPSCGAAEARARKERGTITPDEFYRATNRH